jgi:ABC-type polysaccharide/polyol phosphate transport system ATPase subunit
MNIIDFHHVNKTYFVTDKQQSVAWYKKQPKKPFHALKNCSITLAPGEKVALL